MKPVVKGRNYGNSQRHPFLRLGASRSSLPQLEMIPQRCSFLLPFSAPEEMSHNSSGTLGISDDRCGHGRLSEGRALEANVKSLSNRKTEQHREQSDEKSPSQTERYRRVNVP